MNEAAVKALKNREVSNAAWVSSSFIIPQGIGSSEESGDFHPATFSTGKVGFADTTLGGGKCINPLPQFTDICDPDVDQLVDKSISLGMGTIYEEMIDRHQQRIYLQAGNPRHNSLSNFFVNFHNRDLAAVANHGKVDGLFYTMGKVAGYMVLWPVAAVLGVTNYIYRAIRSATRAPLNKYYYIVPMMAIYWAQASNIANILGTNMGLLEGVTLADDKQREREQTPDQLAQSYRLDRAEIETLNRLLPDIIDRDDGQIDLRAVATRYQRLANVHRSAMQNIINSTNSNNKGEIRDKILEYIRTKRLGELRSAVPTASDMRQYMEDFQHSTIGSGAGTESSALSDESVDSAAARVEQSEMDAQDSVNDNISEVQARQAELSQTNDLQQQLERSGELSAIDGYWNFAQAEMQDGAQWVCFGVNHTGEVTESLSNSSTQSQVAASLNEKSSAARSTIFSFAGGNIGDGLIAETIEGSLKAVKNFLQGVGDVVGLSGLGALAGSGFLDIPDFWENSQTTLPAMQYSIYLGTPFGNPYSIYQDIGIPLSMLMALAFPRKTGNGTYGPPMLVKLWDEGRGQIQIGLVDSLTITRGKGGVKWNLDNQATGIQVDLSIINLSKMLTIPITTDSDNRDLLGLGMFAEEDNFSDYMAVLAGLDIGTQHYLGSKWALKRAQGRANADSHYSMSNFARFSVDNLAGDVIAGFANTASF